MEFTAICRICNAQIKGDIHTLGEHLLKGHEEYDITHFNVEEIRHNGGKSETKTTKKETRNSSSRKLFRKATKKPDELYRTTVETWRSGIDVLTCPKCNTTAKPYIRQQRHKVAYNPIGAFFLLGCWPFCFLPMLLSGPPDIVLCCRKCGHCFGSYDSKTGALIPAKQDSKIDVPNVC